MDISPKLTREIASFKRIAIVGGPATGKTTLAKEIAGLIDIPHVELDSIRYQSEWVRVPVEAFREQVFKFVEKDRWLIEGNYAEVQDIIWLRAKLIIWIDFDLPTTLWRLLRRTILRLISNTRFTNGNKEDLRRLFSNESVVKWAITSHLPRRLLYERHFTNPRYNHLQIVRIRSPKALRAWFSDLIKN
jgi:adenylate kinase family enzyme